MDDIILESKKVAYILNAIQEKHPEIYVQLLNSTAPEGEYLNTTNHEKLLSLFVESLIMKA